MEPDVERVQDGAHTGDGEVQLEVPPRVPRERADPVTRADPQTGQRRGQSPHPLAELLVGLAVVALGRAGHDLVPRIQRRGALQDPGDDEVVVLHQAAHRTSFEVARGL